ncbi:MAG: hypothetical protein GX811_01745, partial [Lentisphaerae bacterium]|nr:hypothetical protein [Lentisphaerota bacterium]
MEDYRYLQQLESIDRDNEFLQYITRRVLDADYRGHQCSQHNRLTFDYFNTVITTIYEVASDRSFGIHVGDDMGDVQSDAHTYYAIVANIKNIAGKATINSLKKNTFPDIARMGFLNRDNKKDGLIDETLDRRKSVYRVSLSETGVQFALASTYDKLKLFTAGIDVLTKNTASELVELLMLNDFGIESISILEYMYILSDDRDEISLNDKTRYLISYRSLSGRQKEQVDELLKQFCRPLNRKEWGDKTLLCDYSNWKNESHQIFGLLANSTYFKVESGVLVANTGNFGMFLPGTVRGSRGKSEYFIKHRVQRTLGFELHHIIPFSAAQNKSQTLWVDDFKNLIYLGKSKHAEFTR